MQLHKKIVFLSIVASGLNFFGPAEAMKKNTKSTDNFALCEKILNDNERTLEKKLQAIKRLIDGGFNINAIHGRWDCAFLPYVLRLQIPDKEKVVQFLLECGASSNATRNSEIAPLLQALLDNQYGIALQLLLFGADFSDCFTKQDNGEYVYKYDDSLNDDIQTLTRAIQILQKNMDHPKKKAALFLDKRSELIPENIKQALFVSSMFTALERNRLEELWEIYALLRKNPRKKVDLKKILKNCSSSKFKNLKLLFQDIELKNNLYEINQNKNKFIDIIFE